MLLIAFKLQEIFGVSLRFQWQVYRLLSNAPPQQWEGHENEEDQMLLAPQVVGPPAINGGVNYMYIGLRVFT